MFNTLNIENAVQLYAIRNNERVGSRLLFNSMVNWYTLNDSQLSIAQHGNWIWKFGDQHLI